MGDFSSLSSHTKIRKNTHICNFILLTNVLIIKQIVKLCNNWLPPKLMQNLAFSYFSDFCLFWAQKYRKTRLFPCHFVHYHVIQYKFLYFNNRRQYTSISRTKPNAYWPVFWPESGHPMTKYWSLHDQASVTAWPRIGHRMTMHRSPHDHASVTAWPFLGRSVTKLWVHDDHATV